jgi:hypothetical protein
MRMLVCGGRDFKDRAFLFDVLDRYLVSREVTDLIHGAARGADALAHQWAYERQVRMWPFPADWKRDGKAAGPIRNQRMLDEGRPNFVVAFPGGKGTADMIQRAKTAGLEVRPHAP